MSPGVTADEIEIGLIYPDSGPLAGSFNTVQGGFEARIGLQNASGGVHGRHIVYRWRDDEEDPPTNLTVSEELVELEDVFAIVEASTATSGGAAYLANAGVPVLGVAVEPVWSEHRNMFTFNYLFAGEGSVDTFGTFLRGQGGTRAMVVRDSATGTTSALMAQQLAVSTRAAGIELADS
nr:ABC transporter substrate-binding protein [Micromonospora sp. DSM 115978]